MQPWQTALLHHSMLPGQSQAVHAGRSGAQTRRELPRFTAPASAAAAATAPGCTLVARSSCCATRKIASPGHPAGLSQRTCVSSCCSGGARMRLKWRRSRPCHMSAPRLLFSTSCACRAAGWSSAHVRVRAIHVRNQAIRAPRLLFSIRTNVSQLRGQGGSRQRAAAAAVPARLEATPRGRRTQKRTPRHHSHLHGLQDAAHAVLQRVVGNLSGLSHGHLQRASRTNCNQ